MLIMVKGSYYGSSTKDNDKRCNLEADGSFCAADLL